MTILAYVDSNNQIHIDPTVVINSNNTGAYKVKFVFQESWSTDLTLYGVFKPTNDIPVSFKCDENHEVDIPDLCYGYYKKLGIGLKGVGYSESTSNATTTSRSFTKDDFILSSTGEYECIINRKDLEIANAILLSINVITHETSSILEPVDYFVRYTPNYIIITLNIDLSDYDKYNGTLNFISIESSKTSNTVTKQKVVATDYYYVPILQGAR